jgi:hypothetical protein
MGKWVGVRIVVRVKDWVRVRVKSNSNSNPTSNSGLLALLLH